MRALVLLTIICHLAHGQDESNQSHGESSENDSNHGDESEDWEKENPECGWNRQSPIDLKTADFIETDLPKLEWINYHSRPLRMTLRNTGHTLQAEAEWGLLPTSRPCIYGGPLKSNYTFQQLHFHWGRNEDDGSEHAINGKRFPMEMHVVHYKSSAGSMNRATELKDGLVVLGYFFKISPDNNRAIDRLLDTRDQLFFPDSTTKVVRKPFPLAALARLFGDDYAVYQGSLTTPPCSEIVTWIVSNATLTISEEQLERFRSTLTEPNGEPESNVRPLQPLNGRKVHYVPKSDP